MLFAELVLHLVQKDLPHITSLDVRLVALIHAKHNDQKRAPHLPDDAEAGRFYTGNEVSFVAMRIKHWLGQGSLALDDKGMVCAIGPRKQCVDRAFIADRILRST